jgi:hypothetical protein
MTELSGERGKKPCPSSAFRCGPLKHTIRPIENSDRTLQESPLLQKVFVYDGGGVGRKLSPFLHQAFNVFSNQI